MPKIAYQLRYKLDTEINENILLTSLVILSNCTELLESHLIAQHLIIDYNLFDAIAVYLSKN